MPDDFNTTEPFPPSNQPPAPEPPPAPAEPMSMDGGRAPEPGVVFECNHCGKVFNRESRIVGSDDCSYCPNCYDELRMTPERIRAMQEELNRFPIWNEAQTEQAHMVLKGLAGEKVGL